MDRKKYVICGTIVGSCYIVYRIIYRTSAVKHRGKGLKYTKVPLKKNENFQHTCDQMSIENVPGNIKQSIVI